VTVRLPDFSTRPRPPGPRPLDLGLLAVAVGAFLLAGWSTWQAWSELRRAEAAVGRSRTAFAAASRPPRKATPSQQATIGAVLLTAEVPPSRVVADLVPLLPAEVRLEGLDLRYGDALSLDLSVVARTAPAYDRFLAALERSPRFGELVPGSELRQGEVRSSLSLVYRPEQP
jgi:hypothetical protein